MKILIKVTKEILEMSAMCGLTQETKHKMAENCAIALAVREILPRASVLHNRIIIGIKPIIDPNHKVIDIDLPRQAVSFIRAFDSFGEQGKAKWRKAMRPMSFEVEVPNELIHEIGISEVYKILSESKTLELVSIN